jgi:2-keto-4-pentenoate hydratase
VPWPFDQIGGTVRSVLGVSERAESDVASTLRDPGVIEAKLDQTVAAVYRATEALERHVEVLGALSDSLPALTESVTRLTDELGRVMEVTAPLAVAEREASRLDRILRRRPPAPAPPTEQPEP